MTQKKKGILTISIGGISAGTVFAIGLFIWNVSGNVTKVKMIQDINCNRITRTEVKLENYEEKLNELPVIKEQIKHINLTLKRIEQKIR